MVERSIAASVLTRRALIGGGSAAILTVAARGAERLPTGLFTLGVASGDPLPDSVILWTRLAPQPLDAAGGMPPIAVPVRWQVATDERFAHIVRTGEARAEPRWGHSVHVDVRGLRPASRYFYRFLAGGETSAVGRTRTAPAAGTPVERLRLAYGSCQKYESGFYAAYRHLVADDPDFVLFLGDYIYEGAPTAKDAVRLHRNPEPMDLGGYRVRYATYKSDPLLQAAHHAAPWVLTWDDHEVANDYAAALDQNNTDPAAFLLRRAAAYQAWYEHQPVRAAPPLGPAMRIYHTLDWGRLAQFQIVDDRQYRGARACQPPGLIEAHARYRTLIQPCPDLYAANRTMLGDAQERWLMQALGDSRAQWNLLAQQTLMHQQGRIDADHPERGVQYSADNWSGYPAARDRIYRRWVEARTSNPVALGGDIHAFAAADVHDPAQPDAAPIAAEFVGGSITSLFHDASFKQQAAANGLVFAENEVRGYGLVDLTAKEGRVTFRGLDDARDPQSGIRDLVRFALEPGRPGIRDQRS